jgi:methyl-accepting chemotaxis protein
MVRKKKSLAMKILFRIGLPVAITFCIVAVISLYAVNSSVTRLATSELTAKSQAVSNEVEGYLSRYMEVARQMATNPDFEDILSRTQPGTSITSVEGFPAIKKALDNVYATDPDNIMVSWVADFDSSQFTQSDGYVSDSTYDITTRSWYNQLLEKKAVFITEPYMDTASNKVIISVVAPVFHSVTNEMLGATCIDVSIDQIKNMIHENQIGETGFYILATDAGTMFYHPNDEFLNQPVGESDMSENMIEALTQKTGGEIIFSSEGVESHGFVSTIGDTGWVLSSGLPDKEFYRTFSLVQTMMLTVFALGLLIIIGLIIIVSRKTVKPIVALAKAADQLALGDIDVNIEMDKVDEDEVGVLTNAFGSMLGNIKDQAEAARNIADGNLSISVSQKSEKDVLGISMGSVVNTLQNLVSETETLTKAAAEGRLATRGDAESFQGSYREIVQGVNNTLDAVIGPLNVAADYVDRISKGDIPEKITDEYNGDFNTIKSNLNTCIDAIGELVADTRMLSEAAIQGISRSGPTPASTKEISERSSKGSTGHWMWWWTRPCGTKPSSTPSPSRSTSPTWICAGLI